jgi:hypothetical protein
MNMDWKRVSVFTIGAGVGLITFVMKCTLLSDVSKIADLMVPIFAVLAGFLIASMTFILSSNNIRFRSKTSSDKYKNLIMRRMRRQMWTFFCYITVLLCIIFSALLRTKFPETSSILERVYLGLGVASIIWSYTLPMTLIGLQREKAYLASQDKDAQ